MKKCMAPMGVYRYLSDEDFTSLPSAFTFASALRSESHASFRGAVNVSLGSLMTLSTGVYSKDL